MKKKFRFLALAMLSVMAFSTISACGGSKKDDSTSSTDSGSNSSSGSVGGEDYPDDINGNYKTYDPAFGKVTGTIHERSMEATTTMMMQDGVTEYKLLIDPTAGEKIRAAVSELNVFFAEATGKTLILEENDSLAYSKDVKYLSLGQTSLLETSGITVDYKTIGQQGYEIVTEGNSIFIAGKEKGVLNGVYDLLGCLFDWEIYMADYCYINKNVKDIPLYDFDIKEVPDFEYRIPSFGSVFYNTKAIQRMRLVHDHDIYITGASPHSAFRIVPEDPNRELHPAWYMDDGGRQLCYTAHGDPEEYEALMSFVVESAKALIIADPDRDTFAFSQNDYNEWCHCKTGCQPMIDKYGTNSSTQIIFMNELAKRLGEWLEETYPEREVMFNFFAYHASEDAPTKLQADGTWSTPYEEMQLRDNIEVMVAPLVHDYVHSVFSEEGRRLKDLFESWRPLAKHYSVWSYNVYFRDFLSPMDTWGSMGDFLKYLVTLNTRTTFQQGAWNVRGNTNFDELKMYLYSKLLWNVNLEMTDLINDYFDKVYREASDTMKKAYWNMRTELHRHTLMGRDGTIRAETVTTKYYSKRYLVNQIAQIEKAYADIEKYKTEDPEYYEMVYNRIDLESVGPRFLLLELYEGTFSNLELEDMWTEFASDARRLSVTRISEPETMEDYLKFHGR